MGYQDAERNQRRQEVRRKLGAGNREEHEDHRRPREQEESCPVLLLPQRFPASPAVQRGKKQKKAPGKETRKINGKVIEDISRAMSVPRRKPQDTFLPECVARKAWVTHRDGHKPR